MPTTTPELAQVARKTDYPLSAFLFAQRGLDFTVRREHGELDDDAVLDEDLIRRRHITGRMLCYGLRDYSVAQYGLLARLVLRRWNIHCCEDFGRIVFAMVGAGLMQKSEEDSLADFHGVFTFDEAFSPRLVLGR